MTVAQKRQDFYYEDPVKPDLKERAINSLRNGAKCSKKRAIEALYLRFPVVDWLVHYKFKTDFINDVICGITVAVMHIPQGMAYAMLANLDPIIGIYMAFFPVLMYSIFASSRHNSMGTFAVICIMTGKVVSELSTDPSNETVNSDFLEMQNATISYSPVQVAAALSFAVGFWLIIFAVFQLGALSVFLSDMIVSGFTTGASIHVLTSQVPKLFGVTVVKYQGIFKIPKTWFSICINLIDSNIATVIISLICLVILIVNNEILKPRLRKYTSIPFPIELVVVIFGTMTSWLSSLDEKFGVQIVGAIPTGLPPPVQPPLELLSKMIVSSLTIAIVTYTVSYSMAKIFAKKLDYNVDATQELYALGLSNMFGSLFSCAPVCASLSRSLVQQTVGGVTQLASFVSCAILVLVLLFIGPVFETLPHSVLASIIAVALKGMFLQVNDARAMWSVSRSDTFLWIVCFLSVVILDIDYGLVVGIACAIGLLVWRNQTPKMAILGPVPNIETDIYLDKNRYNSIVELPGIKICQVIGALHFANRDSFRETLIRTTGIDVKVILKYKRKLRNKKNMIAKLPHAEYINNNGTKEDDKVITIAFQNGNKQPNNNELELGEIPAQFMKPSHQLARKMMETKHLVMDLSGVSSVDVAAARNLASIYKEFESAGIATCFCGLSDESVEIVCRSGAKEDIEETSFFHSVSDVIACISATENEQKQTTQEES